MVHMRLGEPVVALLREMMPSARVSNYPHPMSTRQVCPTTSTGKRRELRDVSQDLAGKKGLSFHQRAEVILHKPDTSPAVK